MAGTAHRDLVVRIVGDAKGMNSAVKSAEKSVQSFGDKLGDVQKALVGAFAGGAIIKFAKQAAQAALEDGRAQERLAKTLENVVGANEAVVASVEKSIAAMESQFAVADDELRPAFETLVRATKDVSQAQSLMQLALDVSAGSGKSLQDVSLALVKAMGGQTRALKDLGITVKDTEGKTLTFAEIQAQLASTFSGQAAEAADSQTGRLRALGIQYGNLQETIGAALLPVLTQLAGIAEKLLGWFNNLDGGTQQLIVQIVAFGGAAVGAVKAFMAIRGAVVAMNIAMASSPITAIAAAAATLGAMLLLSSDGAEEATDTYGDYAKAVKQLGFDADATNAILAAFVDLTHSDMNPSVQSTETFAKALKALGLDAKDTALYMKWFTTPGVYMSDIFDQLSDKGKSVSRAFYDIKQYAGELPPEIENGTKALEDNAAATDTSAMSVDEYNRRLNQQIGYQRRAEEAVKRTTQAIMEAADQIRSKFDAKFAADKAILEAQQGLKTMGEELKKTTKGSQEYTVIVGEQADKTLSAAEAIGELAKKQSGLTGAAAEAVKNNAMLEYLKDVAFKLDPSNPLQRYLIEWITNLNLIPTDINTNITATWRDNIPQWAKTAMGVHYTAQAAQNERNAANAKPPGKAAGGPVAAGTTYLVGERGPELFVPGATGMIVPNHALGGNVTVQVTAPQGQDPYTWGQAIVSALKAYVRSNGKISGITA